ncbi:MAG: DNA primase [Bacteroides sp.]
MIDRATVDRIMDAAQIYEVVSDFVTLHKRGVNYVGLCPFHDDTTPSFSVSPAKGLCKCFACGKGGNAVHFIMEHEQIGFADALRYLAKKYNIPIKERELTVEEKTAQSERDSLFVLNQFARDYFCKTLQESVEGRSVGLAYLRSRGIRDDIIKKFQLGYCPKSGRGLCDEALRQSYKREYLVKTGLCYEKEDGSVRDRFWGRVIFPVHTLSGKVVAFGGRVLSSATKGVAAKYVNSPESEIYHKSNELYGIYLAKQDIVKQDRCYLVEGYTDVISMHQSGVCNVVASSGTALTHGQIRMVHRFTQNMTVLYDGDAAGIKASLRGIDMLLEEGMNIKVCLLPDGDDPDSFARKHNAEDFRRFITNHEQDFIRFKTSLLLNEAADDPQSRVKLISSVVQSIAVIPDAINRDVYIRECSQMLGVDNRLLVSEVAKRREKKAEMDAEQRAREAAKAQNPQSTLTGGTQQENVTTNDVPAGTIAENPVSANQGGVALANPDGQSAINVGDEASFSENFGQISPLPESLITVQQRNQSEFYRYERQLIQLVVRYGERRMFEGMTDEEGCELPPLSVIDYIISELQQDELTFHNEIHRRILGEAAAHQTDPGFVAEHYFINHLDPHISKVCAELLSDRYQLSKYHSRAQKILTDEERLDELVPQIMMSFKLAIVGEEIKQHLRTLQDPAVAADKGRCSQIMARCGELMKLQMLLAKNAGERILLR